MSENANLNKENRAFTTEVKDLLRLVVHSLYSNREIFLRELISNASDALEKLRTHALTQAHLYEEDSNLKIWVDFDKEAKTITVTDNGIGMNRDEIIEHLGTIAKSGTKEFLKLLDNNQLKDNKLIGQFGVGFYSAFIVADKVTVRSRKAGEVPSSGVCWESAGEGDFSVETIHKAERGTEIVLHIKTTEDEDATEFLNEYRLRGIITKYSDHIEFPICMKKITMASEDDDAESKDENEAKAEIIEEDVVNKATALWTLPKSEISHDDYVALFKHISHNFDDPLAYTHSKIEGKYEYTILLYIPSKAPFDLWYREFKGGVKLYCKRVFIMDEAEQFLPSYLRFIKGVVDSNDLPLNVSREILQNNRVVHSIKQGITTRVLALLENMAENEPEKYAQFWKEFGNVLKEAPAEDFQNKDRVAKLLRFSSTHDDNPVQAVSLSEYVARMHASQTKIYYITAESFTAAKNSPHLEIFRQKGTEVLLLSDRVDEWLVSHLHEFDGKQLQSVTKGSLDLGEEENKTIKEKEEILQTENKDVLDNLKKILSDKVKDVRMTQRLISSPACLVSDEHDMGGQLKRLLEAAGQDVGTFKPILELNPEHAIVQKLKDLDQQNHASFEELATFLYEQAVLTEGGHLDDPAAFIKRVNHFIVDKSI